MRIDLVPPLTGLCIRLIARCYKHYAPPELPDAATH